MSAKKIQSTKNYALFTRHDGENRPFDVKKHRSLLDSMKEYGFLECFPIVVVRNDKGNLVVKDGQHRLGLAETLGLMVHFVEETVDFDVAKVNSAAKPWTTRDYARKWAANGLKQYQEGMDFAERHSIPIGTAFALLAGTTGFGNVDEAFKGGTWKIKDREWAEAVAGIYGPLVERSPVMRNARFIEACMAACRVQGFDPKRLIRGSDRCRDKLVAYSTRDAYLDMLEEVYNFGCKTLVGLKTLAVMAMRDRKATGPKKPKTEKDAA